MVCTLCTAPPAIANLGTAISEPGLRDRTDILYFQDFEETNHDFRKDVGVTTSNLTASTFVAFKGSRSLQTKFDCAGNTTSTWKDEANHNGGTLHLWFSENALPEPEELYFRYYVYIPSRNGSYSFPTDAIWDPHHWERGKADYSPARNGDYRENSVDKMPGFGGIYADQTWGGAGRGGSAPNGHNGWSARMELNERSDGNGWEMGYYVYHLPDGATDGTASTWVWDATLQRNTWHCIEGYVKLNTIIDPDGDGFGTGGHEDGILRGWVDGTLAFERTDLVFRFDARLKIEEIYGNFYIGGGWFPIKDCFIFTDNWVVAREPIGRYDEAAATKVVETLAITGPEVASSGDTIELAIHYVAEQRREILIELSDGDTIYCSAHIEVEPGADSVSERLALPSIAPAGEGYEVTAKLLPASGTLGDAILVDSCPLTILPVERLNLAIQSMILGSSGDDGDGHAATRAIDGLFDAESRWSAKGLPAPQYLELDLGSVRWIDGTELVCYEGRAYQYYVEGKRALKDAYTLLVDRTANREGGPADNPLVDDFPAFPARYVRLTITGASDYAGAWASLLEFRVFEAPSTEETDVLPDEGMVLELGAVAFARFNDISGARLSNLYKSSKFPDSPDSVDERGSFEFTGTGSNFGIYAWAWIVPEITGDYTFWIASDDEGVLSLSPTEDSRLAQPIARVETYTPRRSFDRAPSQRSSLIPLVAGQAYYISALMKQREGGVNLSVAWKGPGFAREIIPGRVLGLSELGETPSGAESPVEKPQAVHAVNLAYFHDISGNKLDQLYGDPRFPGQPDSVESIESFRYQGAEDNYGVFAWAWLTPAVSGDYTFWIASDNQGELFLSTDSNPAKSRVIARVSRYTNREQFDRYAEQKSVTIRLQAGTAYYLAAAMKEGSGGDHLAVAWQGPDFSRRVISGEVLTDRTP